MPGFPKERFVDLIDSQYEEVMCGICLDVLKEPKVVTCCQQMYCNECITNWMFRNNTCPNDRRGISLSSLVDPPLMVKNLLMNLKIKCDFAEVGCNSITSLGELNTHSSHCNFNPNKKCIDCGFSGNQRHDCVFELKAFNRSLLEENTRLREQNSRSDPIIDPKFYEILTINSAKAMLNTHPVIQQSVGFNPEMESQLIDIIRSVVNQFNSYEDIAEKLSDRISGYVFPDDYYSHVIAYRLNFGESLVKYDDYYIDLSFGHLRLEIFGTNCAEDEIVN